MDDLSVAARRQLLPNGLGKIERCGDPRAARDVAVGVCRTPEYGGSYRRGAAAMSPEMRRATIFGEWEIVAWAIVTE